MKKTSFAYASAIVIIILLITLSQIAIQVTLAQETTTRGTATLMSLQELRTQRILRSSLMLLAPNPMDKLINPLQVNPAQQLSDDLTFVAQTQTTLIGGDIPVAGQMKALQPDYQSMEDAGHAILADDKKSDKKDMLKQITPMFQHEQKYLQGTFAASNALTQQADDLVTRVRWMEVIIYVITLAIVAYEVFGIVLPAEKDRMSEIADLRSQKTLLQEAMHAQRASVAEEDEEP